MSSDMIAFLESNPAVGGVIPADLLHVALCVALTSANRSAEVGPAAIHHLKAVSDDNVAVEYLSRAREAVFKSGTIVGIPRVINSLTSFRSVLSDHRPDLLTKLDALPSAPKLTEPEILERGRTFFTSIYSTVAPKLVGILTLLHPSLMPAIEAEYGAVLAETHTLNAFETELVMVAGLRVIGGEVEKQVESHRRGSRRHGATAEQVEAMVVLADVVAGRYMGVKESSL